MYILYAIWYENKPYHTLRNIDPGVHHRYSRRDGFIIRYHGNNDLIASRGPCKEAVGSAQDRGVATGQVFKLFTNQGKNWQGVNKNLYVLAVRDLKTTALSAIRGDIGENVKSSK